MIISSVVEAAATTSTNTTLISSTALAAAATALATAAVHTFLDTAPAADVEQEQAQEHTHHHAFLQEEEAAAASKAAAATAGAGAPAVDPLRSPPAGTAASNAASPPAAGAKADPNPDPIVPADEGPDDPSPPPPPPPPPPSTGCKLLGGAFGDFVQLSLGVLGIGGLIVKRFQEPASVQRPWNIWGFDVSKQCIGSLYAHLVNMLLAMGLSTITGGGDECAWYFINFLVDSSLGVILCLILVKVLECWAARKEAGSWQRMYIGQMGNYGNPPQCRTWYYQTLVWLGIVSAAKFGLFFFLIAFRARFGTWGKWLLTKPLKNHPNVELVIVMVIVPGIMNVASFWILDNILKSDVGDGGSPPLSPSSSKQFRVSYEPILEGSGGGGGRRRKGSGGGLDWFSHATSQQQQQQQGGQGQGQQGQHSWLRPMSWNWGGGASGGPGQGLSLASAAGGGPGGPGGGGGTANYKPPVQQSVSKGGSTGGGGGGSGRLVGETEQRYSNMPAWLTTNAGSANGVGVRRPYEDDDDDGSGLA